MSKRAMAVAADLQMEMPNLTVLTAAYTRQPNSPSCMDNPVIIVSDGIAQGFTVSVYGDDIDDIDALARDVFRQTQKSFALPDPQVPAELLLTFQRSEPMLDDSDYRVGERMHFVTIEHSAQAPVREAVAA